MDTIAQVQFALVEIFGSDRVIFEPENLGITHFTLYSRTTRYSISARVTRWWGDEKRPPSYLGCLATSLTWHPGEDWHRGNDLADGPLNSATFDRIIKDIARYEIQGAEKPAKLRPKQPTPGLNEGLNASSLKIAGAPTGASVETLLPLPASPSKEESTNRIMLKPDQKFSLHLEIGVDPTQ